MHDIYSFAESEYRGWLKDKYPDLVEEGEFLGMLTTNAMEGGNWRMKYELRALYVDDKSIESRCILIALKDSTYTFRHGRPEEGFAAMNSAFEYSSLMGMERPTGIAMMAVDAE